MRQTSNPTNRTSTTSSPKIPLHFLGSMPWFQFNSVETLQNGRLIARFEIKRPQININGRKSIPTNISSHGSTSAKKRCSLKHAKSLQHNPRALAQYLNSCSSK